MYNSRVVNFDEIEDGESDVLPPAQMIETAMEAKISRISNSTPSDFMLGFLIIISFLQSTLHSFNVSLDGMETDDG